MSTGLDDDRDRVTAPAETPARIENLISAVTELRDEALALESAYRRDLTGVEPERRASARNLVHYTSVRRHDLRALQGDLAALGLSSLGRMEGHTLATLEAVLDALCRIAGRAPAVPPASHAPIGFEASARLLAEHADALLGPVPGERGVRIMVTMPSEAATDPDLVRRLVAAGMDVMRINCAHDGPQAWTAMVENLRRAERETGRRCRVAADLAGPKLRTGPVATADRALKFRPRRDTRGAVVTPARIALVPAGGASEPPPGVNAVLSVGPGLIAAARAGDRLEIRDARGKHRPALVVEADGHRCIVESRYTTYVVEGAPVRLFRGRKRVAEDSVRWLPAVPEAVVLQVGDRLVLTRDPAPGRAALVGEDGAVREPARMPCTLEEVFGQVRPGERVWFDDGKIGSVVESTDARQIVVRVDHARPGGARLRADKGINLPDTALDLPALTAKDLADLGHVAPLVDMIQLSFVRRPDDIHRLEERLRELGYAHLGIVLKIESRQAFEHLPRLLLAGLRSPPLGVMVARGDLAVEVGYGRLAEVQEEMLWMCEAAHVPVIWATQVLEGLARKGVPSRAEVTDAAMSGRAECVMLNKGPYVVEAVEFLSGVLERMQAHQTKKSARLRPLAISRLD